MSKNKEKDKLKKNKQGDANGTSQQSASQPIVSGASYSDGAALDRVQYLEAKLILKPDRFTSVQSFRDFGKVVQRTAKKLGSVSLRAAKPA